MKRILSNDSKIEYLRDLMTTAITEANKWHHLVMSLRKSKQPQDVDARLIEKGRIRREQFLREANIIKDLIDTVTT